jgi:hypothetical protein
MRKGGAPTREHYRAPKQGLLSVVLHCVPPVIHPPPLPTVLVQRFKYNELETLLLVTSMFILLAGALLQGGTCVCLSVSEGVGRQ